MIFLLHGKCVVTFFLVNLLIYLESFKYLFEIKFFIRRIQFHKLKDFISSKSKRLFYIEFLLGRD